MAEQQTQTDPEKAAQLEDILAKVTKNLEAAVESSRDARLESEEGRDYFDGKQWTEEEQDTLRKRKQPIVTDNMLKDKVEYIIGLEAASRTDPKAFPRTPQDQESAEAATDALRFVADNNDLDTIVSDAFENILIEGMGGCEIEVEERNSELAIVLTRTPWDRMYYDPHSLRKDFSDARYRGSFVWLDIDDAKDRWPDVNWDAVQSSESEDAGDTGGDKPICDWFRNDRRRVRVVQQWYKKGGKVYHCKFIKGMFVEEPKESPYKDSYGNSEDIYAWMSAYVDRDGNRYGIIRRYKSLQDEVNHRRSRSLFLLNSNQIVMEEGAVADKNDARKEANKADGVVVVNPNMRFEIEKNVDLSLGQMQLLADARNALSTTGPAAINNSGSSQSGRAKQIDQQTDVLEMGRLFDQLRAMKREIYIKIWNRVQQFWTEEKWVRIRDDEGRAQFARLNEPVSALQQLQEMQPGQPGFEEAQALARFMPERIVRTRNNVAEMNVDIILEEVPDIINIQSEQFANLVSLATAGVIFPQEVYLEASSLRNKDALKEKLTGGNDPAATQEQQFMKAIAMAEKQAEISGKEAKARKDNAEATQTELENKLGTAAAVELAKG